MFDLKVYGRSHKVTFLIFFFLLFEKGFVILNQKFTKRISHLRYETLTYVLMDNFCACFYIIPAPGQLPPPSPPS